MNFDEILNATSDTDIINTFMLLLEEIENSKHEDKKNKVKVKSKPIHEIYKEGLENYIEEPFVKVCQEVWDKNIFTKESIKNDNEVKIVFDKLSDENSQIFKNLSNLDSEHYCYSAENDPVLKLKYNHEDNNTLSYELKKLASPLRLQDITSGYMSEKEFLMNICSCERVEGLKEHTKDWKAEFIFDPSKVEKNLEEYLKEYSYDSLFVPQEGRIYKDKFYLDAHQKFLYRNSI